jgi:hypothetical protein
MSTEQLADDYARLARQYADLAAAALKRDEERKAEIDSLRAEIVLLHDAIQDLKDTIRELRARTADAEISGSYKAKELLDQRELEQSREREKERRKIVTTVIGGVLTAVVLVVLTALATVTLRDPARVDHPALSR